MPIYKTWGQCLRDTSQLYLVRFKGSWSLLNHSCTKVAFPHQPHDQSLEKHAVQCCNLISRRGRVHQERETKGWDYDVAHRCSYTPRYTISILTVNVSCYFFFLRTHCGTSMFIFLFSLSHREFIKFQRPWTYRVPRFTFIKLSMCKVWSSVHPLCCEHKSHAKYLTGQRLLKPNFWFAQASDFRSHIIVWFLKYWSASQPNCMIIWTQQNTEKRVVL